MVRPDPGAPPAAAATLRAGQRAAKVATRRRKVARAAKGAEDAGAEGEGGARRAEERREAEERLRAALRVAARTAMCEREREHVWACVGRG